MNDKLTVAIRDLEKARVACLEAAVADHRYRVCSLFDDDGRVARAITLTNRLISPRTEPEPATKTRSKK